MRSVFCVRVLFCIQCHVCFLLIYERGSIDSILILIYVTALQNNKREKRLRLHIIDYLSDDDQSRSHSPSTTKSTMRDYLII